MINFYGETTFIQSRRYNCMKTWFSWADLKFKVNKGHGI